MKRRAEVDLYDIEGDGRPNKGPASASFGTTAAPTEDRAAKFSVHLKALNKQFSKWVQEQSPSEFWLDGVSDYVKHAEQIKKDFADVISKLGKEGGAAGAAGGSGSAPPAEAGAGPSPAPPKLFSFGGGGAGAAAPSAAPASKPAEEAAGAAAKPPAPFTFGGAATGAAPATGAAFGSKAPAFGGGAAPSAPTSALFTFGGAGAVAEKKGDAAAAPSSGIFAFNIPPTNAGASVSPFGSAPPSTAVSSANPTAGGGDAEGGDGEDGDEGAEQEPAAPAEKNADDTAERLFEAKSKLMFKDDKDGSWNEIGVGQVIIQRIVNDDGRTTACLVFRDQTTGKVKVNCPLYRGIKPLIGQKQPKTVIVTVYIEPPPKPAGNADAGKPPGLEKKTALFRFGSEDKASEIVKLMETNAPQ